MKTLGRSLHIAAKTLGLATLLASSLLPPSVTSSHSLVHLRVIGPISDDYKSVWYGASSGIFRKHGLEVEPTIIGTGSAAMAAIIGGAADIASTNILAVCQAHDHGVAMQIVAPGALYQTEKPFSRALVLSDSPLRRARDLNGKNVGALGIGDTLSTAVLAWVDQDGGDSHTVKIVEVRGSAMVAALEEHRIDAAVALEPAVSLSTRYRARTSSRQDRRTPLQRTSSLVPLSPWQPNRRMS